VSTYSAINEEREPYSTQKDNWCNSYAILRDTDGDAIASKYICHLIRHKRCRMLAHTFRGYAGSEGIKLITYNKLLCFPAYIIV
jgi:hypothetical protein